MVKCQRKKYQIEKLTYPKDKEWYQVAMKADEKVGRTDSYFSEFI